MRNISQWRTNASEPVVSQAAIRHNRSLRSLLFRLRLDSRLNLMRKGFAGSEEKSFFF